MDAWLFLLLFIQAVEMQIARSRVNQIIESPDPKTFQRYTLDSILFSGDNVSIFQGHENQSRQRFVFYISQKVNHPIYRLITDFETCSKVKIYRVQNYEIIQETFFEKNLNDFLNEYSINNHLEEYKVVQIFRNLFTNLCEFRDKKFIFSNISLNSIVFEKQLWKFDIASSILNLYSQNKIFYPFKEKNQRTEIYALGVVLFSCLFGFYPFNSKTPDLFKIKTYLDHLNEKSPQDCTKIVLFLKSKLHISKYAIDILEKSLSITRSISLDEFMNHPFFTTNNPQPITYAQMNSNQEIKMLSELEPKQVSKVLVAIEKFKTNATPVKRQNLLFSNHPRNVDNVVEFLRSDIFLSRFQLSSNFRVIQPNFYAENYPQYEGRNRPILKLKYFKREVTDLEDEYPCRELLKHLDESRHAQGYDHQRQALLLRYGYPYAVAFQLLKVQYKQSPEIQQKIDLAVNLLLTVSNLNYEQVIPPLVQLHPLQIINQSFQSIKPKYRETLHFLYKHFLNVAIYKYNTAKKQLLSDPYFPDAASLKEQGLNNYRLCWKLLQASLIVRKQGKDLELRHIETSQRKEIQIGINNLLSKYFPNKIY